MGRWLMAASLVIAMTGCMEHKVPDKALSQIPPGETAQLDEDQARIDDVDRHIALARSDLQSAQQDYNTRIDRVSALEKRERADRDVKKVAIESGSSADARSADDRLSATQRDLDRARDDRDAASHDYALRKADVDMLEAKKDVLQAQLQVDRAEGARRGGADVDVTKFRDDLTQAQRKYDDARYHQQQVESDRSYGIEDEGTNIHINTPQIHVD